MGQSPPGRDPVSRPGRAVKEVAFRALVGCAAFLGVAAFVVLLGDVLLDGAGSLSWHLFTNFASRFPERAGIRAPLFGTLWLLVLTAAFSFPVSVGAAIFLEEYAPRTRVTRAIQANIAHLAGVPSIVYGILGLALFVRALDLGRSVLSGALTLSLFTMPIIVLSAQEAIRRVPRSVRDAAYGLGATRWQVIRFQVLPQALPRIITGGILALSRAVGETAPLVLVGAVTFIAFTPGSVSDSFTALPVQIFYWASRPQDEFRGLAAAAIIVLLVLLLGMNTLATIVRNRFENRSSGEGRHT
jgi:phosphate transport system permease protein